MTRILIVEDHPIFRMGLAELIEQEEDLSVCGHAEDVCGAKKAIEENDPEMIILDLSLKESNGLELVRDISGRNNRPPVLVLSMHDESLHAQRCLMAGAKGYIMKQEASALVIDAIRHILGGGIYVSERVMGQVLNLLSRSPDSLRGSPVELLTDRELEVLRLIGKGLSTGKIAGQLNLSARTIGTYRERIKEKLGLKGGGELVRFAVLWVENLATHPSGGGSL